MILVILAAGRGSRLKEKTKNTPKCLLKVGGNSIIDYNYPFIKIFKKIIIVTGYKANLIKAKFKNNKKIFCVFNNTSPLFSRICGRTISSKCDTKLYMYSMGDRLKQRKYSRMGDMVITWSNNYRNG